MPVGTVKTILFAKYITQGASWQVVARTRHILNAHFNIDLVLARYGQVSATELRPGMNLQPHRPHRHTRCSES
jgi:hypothetical protein